MSRAALEYMPQMSAVQLKAQLSAVYKIVDNTGTFLCGDRLNLLIQCSNGSCIAPVDVEIAFCILFKQSWKTQNILPRHPRLISLYLDKKY